MKPLELPVEPGALSAYEDPRGYLRRNADRQHDVAYYVRACRRVGGPVLECGCGNGRVTLHLARAGLEVTALDHSRAMLDDLRARLDGEPDEVRKRVNVKLGDMRRLSLRQRFPVVIAPYDTFSHLYNRDDAEAFLEGAHRCLRPRGRLIFDLSLTTPRELLALADYDPMAQVSRRFLDSNRRLEISQRHYLPEEVKVLLVNNGFADVRLTADFLGRTLDDRSRAMVVSARRT